MMVRVEIYYVECATCQREIEIDRKPRGENLATAFSVTWQQTIKCVCGSRRRYLYSDLKRRYEPRQAEE